MEEFLPQVISTAVAIALFWLAKFATGKLVMNYGRRKQKAEIRRKQMRQVIFILYNILFVFVVMVIWGVQPKNLLITVTSVMAFLGVALFAQWSILSNVSASIIMYFGAPYRVGDRIRILDKDAPIDAVIENIQTFYTHIRTTDNELIVLPNNLFLQKIIAIK